MNHLNHSLPAAWGGMTSLVRLNLHDNRLDGTLPGAWWEMSQISLIALYTNNLVGPLPASWGKMVTVGDISAGNNHIDGPLPETWGGMTSLTTLSVHTNRLDGSLPETLGNLTKIRELRLHNNNPLSGSLPESFREKMTKLNQLDLHGTQIAGPLPDANMPRLVSCAFNTPYDSGLIAVIKVDPTCNGSISSSNETDRVPNRCEYDFATKRYLVRCCSDGGPNSHGSDCPLGGDPQYCPARFKCPAGSEGRSVIQSTLRLCLTPPENVCVLCPQGRSKEKDTVKDSDIDTCSICPVGKYADRQGALTCELCPVGTYNPLAQGTSIKNCFPCPLGTEGSPVGSTSIDACGDCSSGKFFDAASSSCFDCAPGRYGEVPGLTTAECTGACPPGTASDKGKTECSRCDAAKFSKKSGTGEGALRDNCAYCSDHFGKGFTSDAGADTCACSRTRFLDKTGNCAKCPKGSSCNNVGATLADLPIDPEFWRAGPHTAEVFKCPQPKACVGKGNNTDNTTEYGICDASSNCVRRPSSKLVAPSSAPAGAPLVSKVEL